MSITEIQTELFVTDDLTPYRGQWVAIRDGKVVDSDIDATVLTLKDGFRDSDNLLYVPAVPTGSYLL